MTESPCLKALKEPPPYPPDISKILIVAAAIMIDPDKRLLVAKRPDHKHMGGMWEFPGGKVQNGETPEYALMRELREELGVETRPGCYMPVTFASHSYEDFHLLMPVFSCRVWKNAPRALEHSELKWVRPNKLYDLEMPPADLPLIDQIIQHMQA